MKSATATASFEDYPGSGSRRQRTEDKLAACCDRLRTCPASCDRERRRKCWKKRRTRGVSRLFPCGFIAVARGRSQVERKLAVGTRAVQRVFGTAEFQKAGVEFHY